MSIEFFLGAISFYFVVVAYYLVRAFRRNEKGRVKYELKKSANGWRPAIHAIWTAYFIIWSVLQIPGISNWSTQQVAAHPEYSPDTFTYYIYAAPPYVATITILVVAWWFVTLSFKPWIKYSEQEKVWLKEEKDRWREKVRSWFGERVARLVK